MKWSLKIFRVRGIGIHIHFTFFLFLAVILWSEWHGNWERLAIYATLVLSIFTCILLHELGHAFMAEKFGIATRDITLLPIGGLARLERMPEEPRQELLIALAGPAVNVVIALLLMGVLWWSGLEVDQAPLSMPGTILWGLLMANAMLVIFNLLPAFPMDGGRVLRALLSMYIGSLKATRVASWMGRAMAILFGLVGAMGVPGYIPQNPILIFIAFFVWIGAVQELQMAQVRSIFHGLTVERAMLTQYHTLWPSDTLSRVIDLMLSGTQHDFPVVEDGRMAGMVTRKRLVETLTNHEEHTRVQEIMEQGWLSVSPTDLVEAVLPRLQASGCQMVPVLLENRLVGMLSMENLAELLMVRSAIKKFRETHQKKSAIKMEA